MGRRIGVIAALTACAVSLGIGLFMGGRFSAGTAPRLPASYSQRVDQRAEIKAEIMATELSRLRELLSLRDSPKQRSIHFLDTRDLELHHAGLVLRARIKPDGDGDTTVKVLGIDGEIRRAECERDRRTDAANAGSRNCSVTEDHGALQFAHALVMKDRPLKSLFSSSQLEALEDASSSRLAGGVPWEKLEAMGPVQASRWKVSAPFAPDAELSIELWEIPGVNRILEVSLRAPLSEADALASQLEEWLRRNQLETVRSRQSKTEWVLRHFSAQLRR